MDYSYGVGLGAPFSGVYRVTSPSGWRQKPNALASSFHKGTDFGTPMGTRALASLDGVVTRVAHDPKGYGHYVSICDPKTGICAQYAHMGSIGVKVGDTVTRGQELGMTGNSGNSTGPHLDYTVTRNGRLLNMQGKEIGDSGKAWLAGNAKAGQSREPQTTQALLPRNTTVAPIQPAGAIMPTQAKAAPDFLRTMFQPPKAEFEQVQFTAPSAPAEYELQKWLTTPTGMYGGQVV